jgi:formate-dependent nitrite reductase membrane component NrfD
MGVTNDIDSSMTFITTTRHLSWHEGVVLYLFLFTVAAFIYGLMRRHLHPVGQRVFLVTGWVNLIAGVFNCLFSLAKLFDCRSMNCGREDSSLLALCWWELGHMTLFLCASVTVALIAFMFASLMGTRSNCTARQ